MEKEFEIGQVSTALVLETIRKLSEPLPSDGIQRTKKEDTRKGYDTTGYGYQYCVNRFNETLGIDWGYSDCIIRESEGKYKNGTPYWDITMKVSIWLLNSLNLRSCYGGHMASSYADAMKGAFTNAFKKTAAMWGVGRDAYEGSIDDDNVKSEDIPVTDKSKEKTTDKNNKEQDMKQDIGQDKETNKKLLDADSLKNKMSTAKNTFELNARCKKYRPDYDALTPEEQVGVVCERDKRKVWLTIGEGNYEDLETKGINKKG